MSLDDVVQLRAVEDDCVYFFNRKLKKWQKICDVEELPLSVKNQVKAEKERARQIQEWDI